MGVGVGIFEYWVVVVEYGWISLFYFSVFYVRTVELRSRIGLGVEVERVGRYRYSFGRRVVVRGRIGAFCFDFEFWAIVEVRISI